MSISDKNAKSNSFIITSTGPEKCVYDSKKKYSFLQPRKKIHENGNENGNGNGNDEINDEDDNDNDDDTISTLSPRDGSTLPANTLSIRNSLQNSNSKLNSKVRKNSKSRRKSNSTLTTTNLTANLHPLPHNSLQTQTQTQTHRPSLPAPLLPISPYGTHFEVFRKTKTEIVPNAGLGLWDSGANKIKIKNRNEIKNESKDKNGTENKNKNSPGEYVDVSAVAHTTKRLGSQPKPFF